MTIRTQIKIITNKRTAEVVDVNPMVSLYVLPNAGEKITLKGKTYKVYSRAFHLREVGTNEVSYFPIYEQEATLILVEESKDLF